MLQMGEYLLDDVYILEAAILSMVDEAFKILGEVFY